MCASGVLPSQLPSGCLLFVREWCSPKSTPCPSAITVLLHLNMHKTEYKSLKFEPTVSATPHVDHEITERDFFSDRETADVILPQRDANVHRRYQDGLRHSWSQTYHVSVCTFKTLSVCRAHRIAQPEVLLLAGNDHFSRRGARWCWHGMCFTHRLGRAGFFFF